MSLRRISTLLIAAALACTALFSHAQSYGTAELIAKAEAGDAEAQQALGVMYQTGQGVPPDMMEAARWYHMAADQGNAMAQMNLGMMYNFGMGVPQDYVEAEKWFRPAAEQGITVAQLNLKRTRRGCCRLPLLLPLPE